jgi:putative transposase
VSAALMKRPLSRYAWRTGQTSIPTGGFTDGRMILNSDQGCQFTSQQYIDFVKENGIRQSMDGKSRWADNIMIERWFRSFKYEEAYLTQYNNIKEARTAIGRYIHIYNFERCHSALDYQTPAECYYPAMLLPYAA